MILNEIQILEDTNIHSIKTGENNRWSLKLQPGSYDLFLDANDFRKVSILGLKVYEEKITFIKLQLVAKKFPEDLTTEVVKYEAPKVIYCGGSPVKKKRIKKRVKKI